MFVVLMTVCICSLGVVRVFVILGSIRPSLYTTVHMPHTPKENQTNNISCSLYTPAVYTFIVMNKTNAHSAGKKFCERDWFVRVNFVRTALMICAPDFFVNPIQQVSAPYLRYICTYIYIMYVENVGNIYMHVRYVPSYIYSKSGIEAARLLEKPITVRWPEYRALCTYI